MRTPGGRSRASTAGSQGSHGRGHSRNMSSSSIGSTVSTLSRDDSRRRPPPPLMMASDPSARARLTLDTMRTQPSTPPGHYGSMADSPGGFSTPTSTTFSNVPSSPGYGSALGSPMSSRTRDIGLWDSRTPGRRLSVPSGANPFQSPHGNTYPPPYFSPLAPSNASNASNTSSNSSLFGSPTSSTYSFSRRDSAAAAEAEWRRRTWHPSTYSGYPRPATSGLSYYQTPDAPRPAFAPQAATAAQRLPGIETFDQISHRPATPQRCGPSPMQIDAPSRPSVYPGPSEQTTTGPNDRRGHASWDMSLHRNLTKLDLAGGTPPRDAGMWGQQTIAEIQNAGQHPTSMAQSYQPPQSASVIIHQEAQKRPAEATSPQPVTPRRNKRHGWYNGPMPYTQQAIIAQRTSPEDSSSSEGVPTPLTTTTEYHPSIVHSNGYIESHHPGAAAVVHNVRTLPAMSGSCSANTEVIGLWLQQRSRSGLPITVRTWCSTAYRARRPQG